MVMLGGQFTAGCKYDSYFGIGNDRALSQIIGDFIPWYVMEE